MKHNVTLPSLFLFSTLFLMTLSTHAFADILTLRSELRAGVTGGKGMFGERKSEAFQQGHGVLGYGLILGAEVFFIDAWIQHDQFVDGGVDGTWTEFMLGFDATMDIGDVDKNGFTAMFAEFGMGFGFGVGTGQQIAPPLDNSEVTDKGLLLEGRILLGYRLNSVLAVGLTVPLQFGYFTKSGSGAVASDVDNHYAGMSYSGLLTLRAALEIK